MQFFYDPANGNEQYAFNPDVVVSGNAGSYVFTAATGTVLGPYPATLVEGTAPVVVVTPTLAQQAMALLALGLAITSTATPALDATYPCDGVATAKYGAMQLCLAGTSAFPGGGTVGNIKDSAGGWHGVTPAQYTAIVAAIGAFVAGCDLVIDGLPGAALPAAVAAIA